MDRSVDETFKTLGIDPSKIISITPDTLFNLIGSLYVENVMLKRQLAMGRMGEATEEEIEEE